MTTSNVTKPNVAKYISLFSEEFRSFIEFLDNIESTNGTQKILEKFTHINLIKIAEYIYKKTIEIKIQLFKHDEDIFIVPFTIIPEINISSYFYKFTDENKNILWEKILKIHIYSKIITEDLKPELKKSEEEILKPFKDINKKEIPQIDKNKVNDEDVKHNLSLKNLIKSKQNEKDDNELDGMFDIIGNLLGDSDVKNKMQNIKDDDLTKISESVMQLFPNNTNPEMTNLINGMVKGIGNELKQTDITKGNIFENMISVANKMSEKYVKDEKSLPPMEELAKSTQTMMNNINMKDLNPETLTRAMKQMGINKNVNQTDITNAMKQMGLTQNQISNPNRKIKRMMDKNMKK